MTETTISWTTGTIAAAPSSWRRTLIVVEGLITIGCNRNIYLAIPSAAHQL